MSKSIPLVAVASMLLCGGCYTHLMIGEATEPLGGGGRCEDCREEVPFTNSSQVCVWERDFFGYPELRCYRTGYSSSWLYFHNTPWWYRNSYGWRDTRGCPPYYYYDRVSGTCRYYGESRPSAGLGGGGNAPANPLRARPQIRSITSGAAAQSETPASAPFYSSMSGHPSPLAPALPAQPYKAESGAASKPHNGAAEPPPNEPPPKQEAEQKPADKNERPRPSMRGM